MRDERILELISAYLDGEVTAEERTLVEHHLATSADYQQYLSQLRRQREMLQGLAPRTLSSTASDRILAAIEARRISAAIPPGPSQMSESLQELISAHLDGDLTPDESSQVIRSLSESVECREYFEQLRQQQSLLQILPRHKLPAAVLERILAAIEAVRPSVAHQEPLVATLVEPARRAKSRWRTTLTVAGPLVAAGLLLMLAIQMWNPPGNVPIASGDGKVKAGTTSTGNTGNEKETVPVLADHERVRPEDMAVAVKEFRKLFLAMYVYDVYVTPKGRDNQCVETWLKEAGIPLAGKVKIDDVTEKAIFNAQFMLGNPALKLPGKVDNQDVEMILVRGLGRNINAIQRAYLKNNSLAMGEAQLFNDVMLDTPRELEILLRLNEASGVGLAQMKSDPGVLRTARAIPVSFASKARTSYFGGFGLTSMLVASSDERPAEPQPAKKAEKAAPPATALAPEPEGSMGWDEPGQCLIIIRNLKP